MPRHREGLCSSVALRCILCRCCLEPWCKGKFENAAQESMNSPDYDLSKYEGCYDYMQPAGSQRNRANKASRVPCFKTFDLSSCPICSVSLWLFCFSSAFCCFLFSLSVSSFLSRLLDVLSVGFLCILSVCVLPFLTLFLSAFVSFLLPLSVFQTPVVKAVMW